MIEEDTKTHERADGEWWIDEESQALCIQVRAHYEYWVGFDRLAENDWTFHIGQKTWSTPQLLDDFVRLREEILSRAK